MRHVPFLLISLLPGLPVVDAAKITPAYTQFVRERAAGSDYCWAGHRFGVVDIPEVQGRIFPVTAFGAKSDDEVEDRDQIQASSNAVG